MAHPQIATFARLAKDGEAPRRMIFGQATKLSRTMHDIRYNEVRDEFYVGNPFAQSILTFRGDADGQAAPIRTIQGPRTMLESVDTLEIDAVNNEIYMPQGDDVLVFPLTANGNVPPSRIVRGGNRMGWRPGSGIAVDPIHNVLVTDGTVTQEHQNGWQTPYRAGREAILIFDRTASGDTRPLRVIRGPNTGIHGIRQMQVQPTGGWIIISQITDGGIPEPEGTFVGVWHITDSGDVPPRWKIEGNPANVMKKPRGVTLNPKHKELIVSDMRLNAVLTFYFPEIF